MWTSKRESAVHSVWGDWNKGYDGVYSTSFSYPIYEVLRKENRGLEDLFAFKGAGRMDVTINGEAEAVEAELVSGNYYQQMEIQPRLGRAITVQDDRPGAAPVAVISDEYWARRFNRSDAVIGKTILLNLTPTTIVGVNPAGFTGAKRVETSPDIFSPLVMESLVSRVWDGSLLANPNRWWLQIMARARPGVSEAAAQAQLSATLQQAVVALMKPKSGDAVPRLIVTDGSRGLNEAGKQLAEPLFVLLALTGMVLLLACANLANLLLARSTARQREMSVRLALGAGRGRILRQVLTETLSARRLRRSARPVRRVCGTQYSAATYRQFLVRGSANARNIQLGSLCVRCRAFAADGDPVRPGASMERPHGRRCRAA